MKNIAFITLFPDWIRSSLNHSIMARAENAGFVEFTVVNPRNYCYDPHKKVDDIPYGGHPGMLIKAEPVALAIESLLSLSPFQRADGETSDLDTNPKGEVKGGRVGVGVPSESSNLLLSSKSTNNTSSESNEPELQPDQIPLGTERSVRNEAAKQPRGESIERSEEKSGIEAAPLTPRPPLPKGGEGETPNSQLQAADSNTAIILTEPSGVPFTQTHAEELATYDQIIFVCGHYEGIDHRIEETYATHVFSIGDYVLTNGELPALVMADAVTRLLPGVLGNENSLEEESFQNNLLGAPNYTRPEVWRGVPIPDVLKSGNHKEIEKWRLEQARKRTRERRPDLLDRN